MRAEQRFALSAGALDLEIDVVNVAEWPVPAGVGIHPWFVAAPVRVPAELVWPGEGPMPDGLPRPVRPEEDLRRPVTAVPMDRCFTGLTDTSADIGDLTLSWRGPITQVVVYSGEPGFVCVEPQTMATDGIRMADAGVAGTGVIALEPGATLSVGYRLSWPTSIWRGARPANWVRDAPYLARIPPKVTTVRQPGSQPGGASSNASKRNGGATVQPTRA